MPVANPVEQVGALSWSRIRALAWADAMGYGGACVVFFSSEKETDDMSSASSYGFAVLPHKL